MLFFHPFWQIPFLRLLEFGNKNVEETTASMHNFYILHLTWMFSIKVILTQVERLLIFAMDAPWDHISQGIK